MQIPTLQDLGTELQRQGTDAVREQANRLSRFRTSAVLMLADACILALVVSMMIELRSYFSEGTISLGSYLQIIGILVVGNAVVSAWRGLYPGYGMCVIAQLRSTVYSVAGVFGLVIAVSFFSKEWMPYSRSVILASFVLSIPAVALTRMAVRRLLSNLPWYGVPVLVIGQSAMARRIVETLNNHKRIGLRPIAIVEPDSQEAEYGYFMGVPTIGGLEHIPKIANRFAVSHAVVTMPHSAAEKTSEILSSYCQPFAHVTVVGEHVPPSVVWISNVANDTWMSSEIEQRLQEPALRFKKRMLDLVIGIPLFIVSLPVMAVVALAVLVTSGRPIFYSQKRFGEGRGTFRVFKFRTMVNDSAERLRSLLAADDEAKTEWELYHKLKNDPRVTRIGRFLRKYSLDELPQLWNVLRGDMSLVGFRPLTNQDKESLQSIGRNIPTRLYQSTKPGLSGLWQVTLRSEVIFEDRVHIELYYMRNWSIFLDIYIILRTVGTVLNGKGAY